MIFECISAYYFKIFKRIQIRTLDIIITVLLRPPFKYSTVGKVCDRFCTAKKLKKKKIHPVAVDLTKGTKYTNT